MAKVVVPAFLAVVLGASPLAAQPGNVTFTQHIAPLIFEKCAACHRSGGGAPFSLSSYADVRQRATQIALVTRLRLMPPWKPEHGYGSFAGERRLSEAEIALIQRWVDLGAPQGDGDPPTAPSASAEWKLGQPDVIVRMPAYQLAADGADVFRTFVVPIALAAGHYVRGVEIQPGASAAVHHATIKIDRTRSSRLLDDQEAGPGYDGGGGRNAVFPGGHFLAWTPGQAPHMLPDGMSWRLEPDTDLVFELHMMPTGKVEAVQVAVALFFTDTPPLHPATILRLGSQSIDIPPGATNYTIADAFVLPVDVEVTGVQPHAHNLAREIKGVAKLPDGTVEWLIYIKEWDFRWQDVYRYREPLRLPRGTTLSMQYTYDNSDGNLRNPNRPPKRVTFGQTSASEMGNLFVQVVTRDREDLAALERAFTPKLLSGDIAGYEKMLEINPSDARLHADLAFMYLAAGRAADAVVRLEQAIGLAPEHAAAHYALGTVLLGQRRLAEAKMHFAEAVRLKPDLAAAHNNLGIVSHAEGSLEAAVRHYSEALRLDPFDHRAIYNRGRAHASLGRFAAAIADYQHALVLSPDDPEMLASLGSALASSGEVAEAVATYRRALTIEPETPAALVDLAWLLATAESGAVRSPEEGVRLARRAVSLTGSRNATVLETLAVASYAAGDVAAAIDAMQTALDLALRDGPRELVTRLQSRLAAYRRPQP